MANTVPNRMNHFMAVVGSIIESKNNTLVIDANLRFETFYPLPTLWP